MRRKDDHGNDYVTENPGGSAGLDKVEAGQLIEANLDLVLGNDITSPVAIHEMDKFKKQTVLIRIRLPW